MAGQAELDVDARAATGKRERYTTEARRTAILKAAADVFLERGYADASIDAVVEKSGGSKATVYALFGNKEGLFSAAAAECAEEFASAIGTVNVCTSLTDSLRRIAVAYMKVVLSPKKLAMFRTMCGDSARMPESGDIFFRLGPQTAQTAVAKYFRECAEKHLIDIDDFEQLAEYFLGALRGSLFNRALFNPTRAPTDKEVERHIDFVVETFVRGLKRQAQAAGKQLGANR